MGWKDAPLVEDAPKWASAPVVSEKPSSPMASFAKGAALGAGAPLVLGSESMKLLDKTAYEAGGKVTDVTGSPELGGITNAVIQAIPTLATGVPGLARKPAERVLTEAEKRANQFISEGMTIPPSQHPSSGVTSKLAEGFGGKILTQQAASSANQNMANIAARRHLGLPDDAPLTIDTLKGIRKEAGKAYETIKNYELTADVQFKDDLGKLAQKYSGAEAEFPGLGKTPIADVVKSLDQKRFSSDAALDAISILRDKADIAFRQGDKGLGKAMRDASAALEDLIERNIAATGDKGAQVLANFREARQTIAKTYTVEKALKPDGQNISIQVLASELRKDRPLTGELRNLGEFGRQYPRASQSPAQIGSQPLVSPMDLIASGALGTGGYMLGGPEGGAAGAAVPLVRGVTRSAILSPVLQRALANEGVLEAILRQSSRLGPALGVTAAGGGIQGQ